MQSKKVHVLIAFVTAMIICTITFAGQESDYPSMKVYFLGWDVITRGAMTPDQLRGSYEIYLEIKNPANVNAILSKANALDCKLSSDIPLPDVRLVIDIIEDGVISSYIHADSESLDLNGKMLCHIDENFKKSLNLF